MLLFALSALAQAGPGAGNGGSVGGDMTSRKDKADSINPLAAATRPVGIEPVAFPFDPPFIISYWGGPPKEEMTLARYKEIAECGFNVAFAPGGQESSQHLDLCKEAGIKGFVFLENGDKGLPWGDGGKPAAGEIPDIEQSLDVSIAKYASHPALFGFFLRDEPYIAQFDRIGIINRYLMKKDPKHLPFINLFPNYVNLPDWNGPAYESAVAKYIETVSPVLVSWDHYRQVFERGDESLYWHNLEIMRRLTLQAKVPMFQIICSLKHMGYRECSEADLRWQVYTSLAYGTRGVMYFTYWYAGWLAWAEAPSLIGKYGNRDVKWDFVKKVNRRIANLGPTLVQVTSTGVYHTEPVPPGGRGLAAGAPVKAAEGGALAIGCFVDRKAREYILVVNRSFSGKCEAKLALDGNILSASEVSQETGKLLPLVSVEGKTLDMPLEAGEGRLYLLTRKR
jgi:hypothetical protein